MTVPPRRPSRSTSVPPLDPAAWAPSRRRPLRAKLRRLAADTEVQPHRHPWAQVAMSTDGVIRMTAGRSTYIVPPSRALWIPPDVEHVVTVLEDAELRTVYVHPSARLAGLKGAPAYPVRRWPQCKVLEVSPLLRELVPHLDVRPDPLPSDAPPDPRQAAIATLVLDELARAAPVRLGVDLPADKRLRACCEAAVADPARWARVDDWAERLGVSARTLARLFRSELGCSFGQWRQQVLLAQALTMAARGRPMLHIASELGYANASAFTAMVRRAVGQPPSRFFAADR